MFAQMSMDLYSAGADAQREPEPGDLIDISRLGYQHWAIYVGSGYVIHLAPLDDSRQASTCSIMSIVSHKAVVKKERLWDIVGKDKCQVNNKYDTKYKPLPVSKITQEAESLLGKEMHYSVASWNCEHFATKLRYGMAKSDQVRDILVVGTLAMFGVSILTGVAMAVTSLLFLNKTDEE